MSPRPFALRFRVAWTDRSWGDTRTRGYRFGVPVLLVGWAILAGCVSDELDLVTPPGPPGPQQFLYAGVFLAGTPNYDPHLGCPAAEDSAEMGCDWMGFQGEWQNRANQRLIDVETFVMGPDRRFIGLYEAAADGEGAGDLVHFTSWQDFHADWSSRELALIDVETFGQGQNREYIGVYGSAGENRALVRQDSWTGFLDVVNLYAGLNWRLVDVESYRENATTYFVGVFLDGPHNYSFLSQGFRPGFDDRYHELGTGQIELQEVFMAQPPGETFSSLVDIEAVDIENLGLGQYAGVWTESDSPRADHLWIGFKWANAGGFEGQPEAAKGLGDKWQELEAESRLQLIDIEIVERPALVQPLVAGRQAQAGAPSDEFVPNDGGGVQSGREPLHNSGSSGPP